VPTTTGCSESGSAQPGSRGAGSRGAGKRGAGKSRAGLAEPGDGGRGDLLARRQGGEELVLDGDGVLGVVSEGRQPLLVDVMGVARPDQGIAAAYGAGEVGVIGGQGLAGRDPTREHGGGQRLVVGGSAGRADGPAVANDVSRVRQRVGRVRDAEHRPVRCGLHRSAGDGDDVELVTQQQLCRCVVQHRVHLVIHHDESRPGFALHDEGAGLLPRG